MRKRGKHKKDKSATSESNWDVKVDFTKSMCYGGGRGAVVTVTEHSTNKSLERSVTARTKGSRKNKFVFLRVKAPVQQGAKAQAYRDMSSFRNAAGRDGLALKNVKLFLREP